MSLVFTIWYIFALAGTSCSFPCLVLPSGALVKEGLVMTKSLSICLSVDDFISPSLMQPSLAEYETPLSIADTSMRQKINKDIQDLNSTLDQADLIDNYRTLPNQQIYILQNIINRIDILLSSTSHLL